MMTENQNNRIKINYRFVDITDALQETIKELIDKNLSGKLDRYLKKVLQNKDSEVKIDIDIKKNKQEKYEGSFRFVLTIDGKEKVIMYRNDVPFKNITDLVNHAFDHLKRELADK